MGNKKFLRLKCGNPEDKLEDKKGKKEASRKPVTFSRFVLPFAYKKETISSTASIPLWFEEEEKHFDDFERELLLQRKKYFTSETRRVIYQDALWLRIPKDKWDESTWSQGVCFTNSKSSLKNSFCIHMAPPRMVLFNWAGKGDDPGLLGTGFLMLDIWFDEKQRVILDDLLCLNDLFRCFDYPGYSDHWDDYQRALHDIPLNYWREKGTVKRIGSVNKADKYQAYIERWTRLMELPVRAGDGNYRLVPGGFTQDAVKWLEKLESSGTGKSEGGNQASNFLIYNDFRAYVWSAAVLKKGGKSISDFCHSGQSAPWEFGHWIKFLNVDPPSKTPSEAARAVTRFEKDWAKKRTYKRWLHYGTWYGFNYHAGVTIQAPGIFVSHFRELYFDVVLLLFFIRVTLFRFSNHLSRICSNSPDLILEREEFRKLRNEFSRFTILCQFPLLSNQQQAIEMYEMARDYFDIKEFYKEVKDKIDNTHDYLEMVKANNLARFANRIATVGFPLGVAALVAGLFGMNNLHLAESIAKGHFCNFDPEFWILFFIVLITGTISYPCIKRFLEDKGGGEKKHECQ